ncbi:MAG TPA: response regulator [Ferrovibrio sp.]|uniref:response regulator n=1 Tax=Ferrovibrio sp. TaxID=1917215 RepID=UPI002ED3E17A
MPVAASIRGSAAILSLPVLVVDDHRTMRAVIAARLRQIGFQDIDTIDDPVSALTMLGQKRYGVILSDWNMAPMDGLAFLRAVRQAPETRTVPFIMVTAEARPENIMAAKRLGVDGYIAKPFDTALLKSRLAAVLGPF